MENSTGIIIWILVACAGIVFVGLLLMKFVMHIYLPFAEDRDFIKLEIMRSRGNERVHWQHELRRHYMSMIPLVGNSLVKRSREKGKRQRGKL